MRRTRHLGRREVILGMLIFLILGYKVWIFYSYNIHWADEDQALMWLGTVYFSNGIFPEPCFWGQNYGAMLESLLAVPFYCMGMPVHYAVPLATTIFTALPIVFILCKINNIDYMLITAGLYIAMDYEFDILLSVPRSLAIGICICTMACIGLITTRKKFFIVFLSTMAFLGVVITNTAIVILGVTIAYLFGREKGKIVDMMFYLSGIIPGVLYWWFTRNFYITHPEYSLHAGYKMDWSLLRLWKNIPLIYEVMGNMNFVNSALITMGIIAIVAFFLYKNKKTQLLGLLTFSILLSVSVFGMGKIAEYTTGVLLSVYRFLLFMPFTVALFWYIVDCEEGKKAISTIKSRCQIFIVVGLLLISIIKGNNIVNVLNKSDELTSTGGEMRVVNVDDTIAWGKKILHAAQLLQNIDWIVSLSDSRAEGYILETLGYGKYHFYNCHYDRRTWEWKMAVRQKDVNCLLYFIEDKENILPEDRTEIAVENIKGQSIVEYLEEIGWKRKK